MKEESYNELIYRLYPYDKIGNNKIQTPNITFQVTDNCNLACTYCYQHNKGEHTMPLFIAQKFIDLLLENNSNTQQYIDTYACDAVILDFIGGEPFLEVELIDQIIEYFRTKTIQLNHPWQYNWRVSISSNGTLYFTQKVQDFIKKYNQFLSLGISIDGNKELHDKCRVFKNSTKGSYDIAIAAAHDYRKKYGHLSTSKITLSPDNIMYTANAIINLIQEGYTAIHANCIFEKGWTVEHAQIFYQELKILADYLLNNNLEDKIFITLFQEQAFCPKGHDDITNWCGGNGQMLAVDYKGDIYPCIRYMESSLGEGIPPLRCGNVFNGLLFNNEQKAQIEQLKKVNRLTQSTNTCIDCKIAEGCAWCQAYNYEESKGNFNYRAINTCIMHKAQALANCYYWNYKYWKYNDLHRFKLWLNDEESLNIISKDELKLLKLLQYPITKDEVLKDVDL